MHQYKGRLIVHTGSMFSGKTSSLEKDLKRFQIAGYHTVAFKPSIDTRYEGEDIVTHDNTYISAILVEHVKDIKKFCEDSTVAVVGIDEVQFLEGSISEILEVLCDLLDRGITVIVAGLDMDFTGKPFEIVKELMPLSDYLNKHHAVCTKCGSDAWVSHRKTEDTQRVVLGANEEYEPLCRACYRNLKK
ncbi:MAG: thymidine kinase [Tissierellia bacterium]|nr:thymidine kinase [Tissierellia bacterium]